MVKLFSKSTLGFYDSEFHAGAIPKDAKPVSNQIYQVMKGRPLDADSNGIPVVKTSVAPLVDLLESAKSELRALREPMLSAVTGIGWEASEAGDAELVQEARNIRNALRDITDDTVLNSAKTYEEMRAAGVAAFRRIASDASEAFSATFREFK